MSDATGAKTSLLESLMGLLERLKPVAQNLGTQNHLNTFHQLVKMGTGSQRQLDVYDRAKDLVAVVRDLDQQLKYSLWGN